MGTRVPIHIITPSYNELFFAAIQFRYFLILFFFLVEPYRAGNRSRDAVNVGESAEGRGG